LSGRFARAAFLPTPEELEAADLFLGKAASDLAAARLLAGDAGQDDNVVGFHPQQAVEKALKAVVAVRSLEIPRSHDLGLLIRLLDSAEHELPVEIREADWLNPWAVTRRYDHPGTSLDRRLAVEVADKSLRWARERVKAARGR
jgi:HEPN domain-containing protein